MQHASAAEPLTELDVISTRLCAGMALLVSVVSGCRRQPETARDLISIPSQRCVSPGTTVDSAFVVEQARRALSQPGEMLAPRLIQPVRDQSIELGLLVSLEVANPPKVVGGGGLVWVDLESGCALVLRRYE